MTWFNKLCRNMGLMIHNVKHPQDRYKQVTHKKIEEEKRGSVTIRRTTIEEIEVKKDTTEP